MRQPDVRRYSVSHARKPLNLSYSAEVGLISIACPINRYANAGGYCHRENVNGVQQSVVWFSDEMTPRYEWTWPGGLWFASAAIRFYCWRRCVCSNNPTVDKSTSPIWKWMTDHELYQGNHGSIFVRQTSQPGNTQMVLPEQDTQSPQAGRCGSDGR